MKSLRPKIMGPYERKSQKKPYYTVRFHKDGQLFHKESISKRYLEDFIREHFGRVNRISPRASQDPQQAPCGKTIIPLPGRCEQAYRCSDYRTCVDLADGWPGWRIQRRRGDSNA